MVSEPGGGPSAVSVAPADEELDETPEPAPRRRAVLRPGGWLWLGAVSAAPVLYVAFVAHYGVNSLFNDDWSMVPIVHAALHGRLSFGMLWAQHNEHRVLVPNLAFIAFGRWTSLDARTILLASAALFVAGYAFLVALVRRYAGRPFSWVFALLLGAIWFSLSDVESALLAYQITWYVVTFLLMVLLFLLARTRLPLWLLAAAGLVAVAASYSSLQGLFLWPVGALCLWRRRGDLARFGWTIGAWSAAAAVTVSLYFVDYSFAEASSGSFRYAFEHLGTTAQFLLAEVGNLVPSLSPGSLHWHMALGALVVLLGVGVLLLSAREVRREGIGRWTPLPAALVGFAILFDLSSGLGRVSLGLDQALAPRYTMGNLLAFVGVIVFLLARLGATRPAPVGRTLAVSRAVLVVALAAQVGVSTNFGLEQATQIQRSRQLGAATVVHLGPSPDAAERQLVKENVYFSYPLLRPLLAEARADHLSVFARR
jgi:hypothetical protein